MISNVLHIELMFLNEIVEFETTFEKAVSVSLGVCIAASRSY